MKTPRRFVTGFRTALLLALLLALVLVLRPARPAGAQNPDRVPASARFELFRLDAGDAPGHGEDALLAVLWFTPDPGWHTYAHVNGQAGAPLSASVSFGPGKPAARLVYPAGRPAPDVSEPDKAVFIHDGPAPVMAVAPPGLTGEITLTGAVRAVLCSNERCLQASVEATAQANCAAIPGLARAREQAWYPEFARAARAAESAELAELAESTESGASALPGGVSAPAAGPGYSLLTPRFAAGAMEVADIGKAVLFALLAGLILNVMPCVLPVASLKFSGFLAASSEDPLRRFKDLRRYNVFFALGILTYFLILSVVLGLAEMAWGQLFQSTGFILGMATTVFALSLSLFGLYNLPVIDLKRAPKAAGHVNTRVAAFATGILATLMATPCSGPFLGGVLAWTMLQPVWVISTVFVCIGLGMSGPYLVFALRPDLIRFFPKPGPWLEYLEKGVGFVLLATSLYFLSVLPARLVFPALFTLLAVAFAAWMWGQWTSLSQSALKRRLIRLAAVVLVLAAGYAAFAVKPPAEAEWEPFTPQTFRELLGKQNMLIDFTADWCPNCKLVEKTALTPENRAAWKRTYNLRFLKADLTSGDPEAMALLRALKSQSIPVTALFPRGPGAASPLVLRDLFTASRLAGLLAETFK
ncbi:MAG: thioredoxin family protein [Desulfovibrionaceae bacterium]|nr:thioredoxin family protein [Desulfovibrionaceae bacterium]MBF0513811.1 thioredoxin family protein [Desulfovibrionaceae bacterium]